MRIDEFHVVHSKQCGVDRNGWFQPCKLIDGTYRLPTTIRGCDVSCTNLGETVRIIDRDNRMGSGILRWPQSVFGTAGVLARSARARLKLHDNSGSLDDRGITHVRRGANDAILHIYRALPRHAWILRARDHPDGEHVDLQLAKPVNSMEELKEMAGENAWDDSSIIPSAESIRKKGILAALLETNPSLEYAQISEMLTPRPGVFRVPNASQTKLGSVKFLPVRNVKRSSDDTTLDIEQTRLVKCVHAGTRRLLIGPTETSCVCVQSVSKEHDSVRVQTAAGLFRYMCEKRQAMTPEHERQNILRFARFGGGSARRIIHDECSVSVTQNPQDGRMVHVTVLYDGNVMANIFLRHTSYNRPGGGFLYVTDEGIATGHPLTHSDDRTINLDCDTLMCGKHRNLAGAACITSGNGRDEPRATLIGMLVGLGSMLDASCLFIEAYDPVWRAQLSSVLKVCPVVDDHKELPEFKRQGVDKSGFVEVALTPDETHVRINKSSKTIPLEEWRHEVVMPFFSTVSEFNAMAPTIETLSSLLEPCSIGTTPHAVIKLVSRGSHLAIVSSTVKLSTTSIFRYRHEFYMNYHKSFVLHIDRFVKIHVGSRLNLSVWAGDKKCVLDLSISTDPRTLLLPSNPIYKVTGTLDCPVMYRPFPSANDIAGMLEFCRSTDADLLFS